QCLDGTVSFCALAPWRSLAKLQPWIPLLALVNSNSICNFIIFYMLRQGFLHIKNFSADIYFMNFTAKRIACNTELPR
ncbi:MAG: hypothetical protein KHX36_07150, partial [Clostridiales bacterium]|nr:hypothetical protein [Clostridiales bacterium]